MDTVSIIIPCYNSGLYLEKTVNSARAQTYPACEIIIADDHSSETHTRAVLGRLAHDGITVISTPQGKKGPAVARNTAIAQATGSWILPLDADDCIDKTYVAKAMALFASRPDISICYCQARFFGLKQGKWELPPYNPQKLLYQNMIFTSAIFRKSDWKRVGGYDEEAIYGLEDHSFWIALHAIGCRAWQLPETLFSYRIHRGSHSAQHVAPARLALARQRLFDKNKDFFQSNAAILYQALTECHDNAEKLHKLFTFKLFKPLFHLENALRTRIKKLLRR